MSAEVTVLAPMAVERTVDTRQAPARTETVRGKVKGVEREAKGPGAPRVLAEVGYLVSLSGGASPSTEHCAGEVDNH